MIPVVIFTTLLATIISIGGSFEKDAYAAEVTWDGGGDDSNWSDERNWSTDTVPTGADSITIPDGASVLLDNGFELTSGSIMIKLGGTVFVVSELRILEGGTLDNNGGLGVLNGAYLGNKGVIYNGGGFDQAGTLENVGTIINDGDIQSDGIIDNNGVIENNDSGIIRSEGTGTLVNSGSIQSSGTIEVLNSNDFDPAIHNVGSIENSGSINVLNEGLAYGVANYGEIFNGGTLFVANTEGVGIYNAAVLTNYELLLVKNSGDATLGVENEGGSFTNYGTIDVINSSDGAGFSNHGTGTFINESTGTITIINAYGIGIYKSEGAFTNYGRIDVENSGVTTGIYNGLGMLTNESNGIITLKNTDGNGIVNLHDTVMNNGTLEIKNSGNSIGILNFAIFTNNGIAVVQNADGIGIRNIPSAFLTNYGTINVLNTGGTGISNSGTFMSCGVEVTEDPINATTFFDCVGPTIEITSPVDGSSVSSSFLVEGTAFDNGSGVATVTVNVDGINVGTSTLNEWVIEVGALTLEDHVIEAFATDNAGNVSDIVSITVHVSAALVTEDLIVDISSQQETMTNVKNSLVGPLKKVSKILNDGNSDNDLSACGKLDEFIANVDSKEASGKLDSALADQYRDAADAIKAAIGC